ncbi:MAG: PAS domain S-box protein [Actinomycetota bacterium]|nr:PAS domain S-box protein [Actinomycetota bacterium]
MLRGTRPWPARYGVAALAVAVALVLQALLIPLFGGDPNSSPFMVFFAAVIVAAWFGGLGPGLLGVGLSALLAWYFFLTPQFSLALGSLGQALRLLIFAVEGAVISSLVGAMHSARRRAEASAIRARENEESLRESEEEYRAMFELANVGKAQADPATGRLLRVNPRFCEITGYSAEELLGMTFSEITHPGDRGRDLDNFRRMVRGEGDYSVEKRYVRKDGSVAWVNANAVLIRDAEGRPLHTVASVLDITEEKRAEQALSDIREAERGRMARELHDGVLQDLAYTAAALEVTRVKAEDMDLDEELRQAMDAVRRAAGGLREAIYDLRAHGHDEQRADRLLRSLIELNRERAPELETALEVEEGSLEGLSERISTEIARIVQEALTNVRRHSGASKATVSLGKDEEGLVAEVSDDGRGFDPGAPPGIGFRSMRERANAMGGRLEVHSELGRGTRVRVRLPATGVGR